MTSERRGVLRDPEFLKFWGGQSVSLLGSQFTVLALPLTAAVTLRASPAEMGLLGACQFAPGLLAGPVAGVVLDRVRRRSAIVVAQLVSASVLVTIPGAAILHVLSMPQLYVVALLTGGSASFQRVAQAALLPALVARDRLVEANARYLTSATLASLTGPGLAGAVVQLLTAPVALLADAASFVVGAATSAWVRVAEPRALPEVARQHPVREAFEGLVCTWRHPLVRGITGTLVMANAGSGLSQAVFVLLFVGRLGVSPAQLGLTFAVSSLSSLIGAQVIRPVQRWVGLGRVMVLATVLVAAGLVIRAAAAFTPRPLPLLLAGSVVAGFGLMSYNIPQQAVRQAVVPDRLLGRTSAATEALVDAGLIAGPLAGGLLGQLVGLRPTLLVATAVGVLCVLPGLLSPVRSLSRL